MIVPEETVHTGCQCTNTGINKDGACICANCQCHIRRQRREEHIQIQYIAYGVVFSFIIATALYMLVIRYLW